MREAAICGGIFAVLLNSEVFTLFLLVLAAAYGLYKLFAAAAERN